MRINTSGNVGIGLSSPIQKLSVNGTANITDDTYIASNLFVNESNVGIGTTAPGAKLDVWDGYILLTDTDVLHSMTGVVPTNAYGQLTIVDSTAGGLRIRGLSDSDQEPFRIQGLFGSNNPTDTSAAIVLSGAKYDSGTSVTNIGSSETVLQVRNNAINLFTVLGSGNVGIGTTSPTHKLQVVGNISSTSDDNTLFLTDLLYLDHTKINVTNGTAGISVGILFRAEDAINETEEIARIVGNFTTVTNGSEVGELVFYTTLGNASDGMVFKEAIRINGSGFVGIGTTSPTHTLNVLGNANITGKLYVSNGTLFVNESSVGIGLTTPTQKLNVLGDTNLSGKVYAGNNTVFIDSVDEEVGIGLRGSSPVAKLHINGSTSSSQPLLIVNFTHTSPTGYVAKITRSNNVASGGNENQSALSILDSASNIPFYVETSAYAPLFIINGSGQVGIGTRNPVATLDVAGASSGFVRINADGGAGYIKSNYDLNLYADSGADNSAEFSEIHFFIDDVEKMILNSSGYLGVGIGSPSHTLNVNGTVNITDDTYIANTLFVNESSVGIGDITPEAYLRIGKPAGGGIPAIIELTGGTASTDYTVARFGVSGTGAQLPAIEFFSNSATLLRISHYNFARRALFNMSGTEARSIGFSVGGPEFVTFVNDTSNTAVPLKVGIGTGASVTPKGMLEISDGAKGIVLNPNSGGNQNSSYINTTSGNLTISSTGGSVIIKLG